MNFIWLDYSIYDVYLHVVKMCSLFSLLQHTLSIKDVETSGEQKSKRTKHWGKSNVGGDGNGSMQVIWLNWRSLSHNRNRKEWAQMKAELLHIIDVKGVEKR